MFGVKPKQVRSSFTTGSQTGLEQFVLQSRNPNTLKKRKASFMGGIRGYHVWLTCSPLLFLDCLLRAALDCHTVSLSCRGRWSLTTARSHPPDSPPEFTAWDCSPLLPFATCAGLDRTARIYRGRLLGAKGRLSHWDSQHAVCCAT